MLLLAHFALLLLLHVSPCPVLPWVGIVESMAHDMAHSRKRHSYKLVRIVVEDFLMMWIVCHKPFYWGQLVLAGSVGRRANPARGDEEESE
jgi:hypothetical protein